jgi:hypothetical protein
LEIVRVGGLDPIIRGIVETADLLLERQNKKFFDGSKAVVGSDDRYLAGEEELAAQCSRALRNLSVNGTYDSSK